MATIANLSVLLSANTGKFDRGMKKSSGVLNSFKNLAGLVGIGVGVALVKNQLAAIDSLGKVADKVGIATEKLAGLRLAAELTGNSTEALDKGLEKLALNVSEAAQGLGEAKAAIAELKLDATKLNQLPLDQQFLKIADAMKKVENQSDKVRLAYRIFGRSGVGLVNTLEQGSEGLKEIQAQAERLGIALSRTDISKVEKLNDSMTLLKSAFEGVLNEVILMLAENADGLVGSLTDMVVIVKDLAKEIGPLVAAFAKLFGFMAKQQNASNEFWAKALRSLGLIEGEAEKAHRTQSQAAEASAAKQVAAAEAVQNAQKKITDGMQKQIDVFGMTSTELKVYELGLLDADAATIQLAKNLGAQLQALNDTVQAEKDAAKAAEEMAKAHADAEAQLDSMAQSIRSSIATPLQVYEDRLTELNTVLNAGKITWNEYGLAVRQAREQMEGLNKASEKADGKSPGIVKFGTQEAIAIQAKARNQADNKVVKNQEKDLEIQRNQLEAMRAVRNLVGSDAQIEVANF